MLNLLKMDLENLDMKSQHLVVLQVLKSLRKVRFVWMWKTMTELFLV